MINKKRRKTNPVQRLHRRARFRRISRIATVLVVFLSILFVVLGATDIAAVKTVRVVGSNEELAQRVDAIVQRWLHAPWLLVLSRQRVARFSDVNELQATILAEIPIIRHASISVNDDASLGIAFEEREPRGIWCRSSAEAAEKEPSCQFWDNEGVFWGETVPSTGPLLILVRDERAEKEKVAKVVSGILTAAQRSEPLGIHIRTIVLPDAEPGGARAITDQGYVLYLDMLGDVEDQFDTLEVLLADRASDPSFTPLYIDLRTPGRVYYQ